MIIKKLRIQLLDQAGVVVKDRLVGQNMEFDMGPSEKHDGPLRLEAMLEDKSDVEKLKMYLDRLVGDLPIPKRKTYSKGSKEEEIMAPVEELLAESLKCETQDELIEFLRARNFAFVDSLYISDFKLPINVSDKHSDRQFMIRQLKEAKSVLADKWDPQLAYAFNIKEKKVVFYVYLYGSFHDKYKKPWKEGINFKLKKTDYTRFPHYMTPLERIKYQNETRAMKLDPEKKPTKFYLRWKPTIDEFNGRKKS